MHLKTNLILILSFVIVIALKSQTLDQAQLNNTTAILTRNLPGYSILQYFTAGITGTLVEIDVAFVDSVNGNGTLKIYSGMDTTGVLLQTNTVKPYCQSAPCIINFSVSVPVVSGQTYVFRFIPGTGIRDPYYLEGEVPGTYSNGKMGYINPFSMGYSAANPDLFFKTYVLPASTDISEHKRTPFEFKIFPNPAKELMAVTWENADKVNELRIIDILGKTKKRQTILKGETKLEIEDLQSGIYFVILKNSEGSFATQRVIIH